MQKIKSYSHESKSVNVFYNSELDEYVIRFYSNGIHLDASDYFTNDGEDAINTAKYFIDEEKKFS